MRNFLYFLLFLLLVSISVCIFAWYNFISPSKLSTDTNVILPKASGFRKTIDILAENNVIIYPLFFKAIAYISGDAQKIKAGEYNFPSNISPQAVLQILVQGKVVLHKITIPEGLNIREITALLNGDEILVGELPTLIAEGSLLPETYYFSYGDTRASMIARMQEKMQKTITELWEKRADGVPFSTPEQAIILASIVEKETAIEDERPRVAAVFINRLKKGMKLQSDPTTIYGIEQAEGKKADTALTLSDLKKPTAFNTYTIDALPPTPIANAGKAALEAVLHPLNTDELYFVATGTGGHNFASTLTEHNKNVAKYREEIKK